MDINTLIIISCICILFVICRIFIVPIKWVLKLVCNSILGGFIIWVINVIGGIWGFHIGLNVYTSALVRFAWNSGSYFFDFIEINTWIKKRKPLPTSRNGFRTVSA